MSFDALYKKLARYINKLEPVYGLQKTTFNLIKLKGTTFTVAERHGISVNAKIANNSDFSVRLIM